MLKLNKKLWSFNVGCVISASFVWLMDFSKTLPVPNFIIENQFISVTSYGMLVVAILAALFAVIVLLAMHKILNVHSSEHTFWLVLPVLVSLILTSILANALIMAMLGVAVPALFVMLAFARQRKERRIFDMEKAIS